MRLSRPASNAVLRVKIVDTILPDDIRRAEPGPAARGQALADEGV